MKKIKISFLIVILATILFPTVAYAEEEIATPVGSPAIIVVNRTMNLCMVYDAELNHIKTLTVSTGRPGHETPLGTYHIYQHATGAGYHLMVDGTYGRWCMRFKEGGYMFHSVCYAYNGAPEPIAQELADLGSSVSRGCVRLSPEDSQWLYTTVPDGAMVVITD